MAGRESDVKRTLEEPDEIRASRVDPSVLLFYKSEAQRRWICAVLKRVDHENGFLITTDPMDALKEGRSVWTR